MEAYSLEGLTPKEQAIYIYMCDIYNWNPPTYKQIAEHMGHKSLGCVGNYIRSLKRKGYLLKNNIPIMIGRD